MRLTLRTLLAYMDDILDPADKEELAKKIESSGFAEDLIYRTQDTMRRLRLSAPQVIGTGMALDPNTVSEYLDNVMPPDNVGDFERICLESPMHLAEVASSHHVLTMVLGEPADIDPAMRERMHAIPRTLEERKRLRIEPAHAAPEMAATQSDATAEGAAKVAAPAAVELPDYLRTSMWSRYQVALTTVAVVLLMAVIGVLVVQTSGWFPGAPPTVAGATSDQPTAPPAIAPDAAEPEATEQVVSSGEPGGESLPAESPETAATGPAAAPLAHESSAALPLSEAVTTAPPTGGEEATANVTPAVPMAAVAVDNAGGEPSADADTSSTADSSTAAGGDTAALSVPATAASVLPDEPAGAAPIVGPAAGTDGLRVASSVPAAGDTSVDMSGATGQDSDVASLAAEPVVDLGTFLGGKVVLLRYNDDAGAWFRLPSRSTVTNGDKVLALPAFRPKISLASGVHVDLSGGSQVVVRTAEASEAEGLPGVDTNTPAIEVTYGRIVLINTANEDNQVVLKLGPTVAGARLSRGATLAVEVERAYVPGNDPRKTPAPLVAHLYVPAGEVDWRVGDSETAISEPVKWSIADGVVSAITTDSDPPGWIDQEPTTQRSEQLYGAPAIEESLNDDQPADVQLLELFLAGRRREVKSLAARASVHVGQFVPFIEALRDSDQRPNWRTHIESLRAAMALSPESATKVREALVEQRGEKAAADLYEMLCGYNRDQIGHTPEEMEAGALARLIDWLEDDNLDYRVLAVQNLREITGKNLLSNPAGSLNERALGVRRWRERLKSGELEPLSEDQDKSE